MTEQKSERPARGARAGRLQTTPPLSTTRNGDLHDTPSGRETQAALSRASVFVDLARAQLIIAARHGASSADTLGDQARLAELAATIAVMGKGDTVAPQRAAALLGVSLPTARRTGSQQGFARKLAGRWQFDRAGLLRFLGGPA